MNKTFYLLFIVVLSFDAYAGDHSYSVSGENENGIHVRGYVESTNGDRQVGGELTYPNGTEKAFDGEWDGRGHIEGTDEDGTGVSLDVVGKNY